MVRTGACFYEVWPLNHAHTDRIMGALDQRNIIRWQVSAWRAGERLPMYVVLNAPYRVTNTDIHTAMARYGDVNIVKQQKYRQWPSISNGHRSVSYKKVHTPVPGHIKVKGATLTVRVYERLQIRVPSPADHVLQPNGVLTPPDFVLQPNGDYEPPGPWCAPLAALAKGKGKKQHKHHKPSGAAQPSLPPHPHPPSTTQPPPPPIPPTPHPIPPTTTTTTSPPPPT